MLQVTQSKPMSNAHLGHRGKLDGIVLPGARVHPRRGRCAAQLEAAHGQAQGEAQGEARGAARGGEGRGQGRRLGHEVVVAVACSRWGARVRAMRQDHGS